MQLFLHIRHPQWGDFLQYEEQIKTKQTGKIASVARITVSRSTSNRWKSLQNFNLGTPVSKGLVVLSFPWIISFRALFPIKWIFVGEVWRTCCSWLPWFNQQVAEHYTAAHSFSIPCSRLGEGIGKKRVKSVGWEKVSLLGQRQKE